MAGMVKREKYGKKTSNIHSIDVLQCPPKGAKKDNLYIDTTPDDAFNLDYRIRVADTLEWSRLLANLHMTAGGKFFKMRKSGK